MNRIIKRVLVGLLGGALTGVIILGIGGRLLMRSIMLMAGGEGGFSWGGSLEVVLLGLIVGLISGGVFSLSEKINNHNNLLVGLIFGTLVFLAIILLPIDGKGAASGFPELQWQIYLLFGGLFLLFGLTFSLCYRWLLGNVQ